MADFSLDDLDITDSHVLKMIKRRKPKNYESFVETLYEDIDSIISDISDARKYIRQKYQNLDSAHLKIFEDDMNIQIVNGLKQLSYSACHDKYRNGHVDIHVEIDGKPYKWLGESKIWTGLSWIHHGFKQLIDDYSTGEENECCGGIIIYAVDTLLSTNTMLESWASFLFEQSNNEDDSNFKDFISWSNYPSTNRNSFFSSQIHPHSGLPDYKIRHLIANFRSNR